MKISRAFVSRVMNRRAVGGGGGGRNRLFSSACPSSKPIAFLGLGNMGLPMAINLATKSERPLIAFDLDAHALKAAERVDGIHAATSLESIIVGETSKDPPLTAPSTVITMLPGDAAVDSVMGVICSSVAPHTTIVDCSTVSPTTSRKWHDAFAARDCLFVDAPVSGGVKGARDATLTFMVGSDGATLGENEGVHSALSHMGSRIVPCGGPGAGAAVKLCNNLALAAQMVGVCEAMNLGEALGVDPIVLASVMNASTARSWSCEVDNPHPRVAAVTGSPASDGYRGGFGTRLMLKDLGLAVAAGKEAQVALPIGNAVSELYRMADLRGLGDKDFGVILQFLRGR